MKHCCRSAAISATCGRRSIGRSRCSATAATCASSRARATTAPALGRRRPAAVRQSLHRGRHQPAPQALLARAQSVERALGRDRSDERRWGPRAVDIDLLAYDDLALNEPELTLPHPRLLERAFVLVPLAEIAPERTIGGIRVRDALARLDTAGIEQLPPRL